MEESHKPITVSAEELALMPDQTFVWDVDLSSGAIQDDEMDVLSLQGSLTVRRQANLVVCQGDFKARVRLVSDRSLTEYETEIPVRFEDGLKVAQTQDFPNELELSVDDAVEQIAVDQAIDLLDLIRQHLILNLPMQKNDPENCYTEDLSRYARSNQKDIDPAWEMIRRTVENWENPSQN